MIELRGIHKTYHAGQIGVKALQAVSLSIAAGEFVAVMGSSGSGKSTLLHLLGLLDRPNTGEYFFCGQPIHSLSDEQLAVARNKLFGFVFQQFHLLPRMSALDNVCLPLIYSGRKDRRAVSLRRLQEVGLGDRLTHAPNELSGGQQQRVAIARALVNDPLVILADEPTGNLDSASKLEIMSLFKQLHESGKTIVVVTHENEVAAYAQRVIVFRDGCVVSDEKRGSQTQSYGRQTDVCEPLRSASHAVPRAEFFDFVRQALTSMVSHKVRSFLSMLGILIGVAAVIAMLAIGQGANESIRERISSLGSNLLMIRPGSARVSGVAMESGLVTRFTLADSEMIARLPEIEKASASVTGRAQIVYGNQNWNTQVEGVSLEYEDIRNAHPFAGRFFTDAELKQRDKVVLLGTTVARELFGSQNPVGAIIKINAINFQIIGVLPSKGATTFRDQDDTVVVPITTAMYRLLGKEYIDSIYAQVKEGQDMEAAQQTISALIVRTHRLIGDREDSFQIRNMADLRQTLEATTKTMALLLGAIAAISLVVGGIGIMNIMLVSVTERTREIGLRKAIGATRRDILMQFLVESILLCVAGGLMGILLGGTAAFLISRLAGWAVRITVSSLILATTFSIFVGLVFGLWPARQAALLDPIEALRYE